MNLAKYILTKDFLCQILANNFLCLMLKTLKTFQHKNETIHNMVHQITRKQLNILEVLSPTMFSHCNYTVYQRMQTLHSISSKDFNTFSNLFHK